MAQVYNAKVMFAKGVGAPSGGMVLGVTAADNYAVLKPRINELKRQVGAPPSDAPEIHITGPKHPDKTELSGSATLLSLGIVPAETKDKVALCIYVDLPPEPETECGCNGCTIL
ncbi:hypothetical protein IWQ56_000584 [Coemansia nantahalensis]|uniref:Uncharacterized protein n=2 Tax=Coemansia TaxID=4863 RepID=A0ACC1LFN9_9FUNG|nr:hypothetical protein IWQ57_001724 [Coemansia nantahalensis]KAJ2774427.1 hypothetical protein IWQ56_000584 [Coemansia nantahalensis]KAJ2807050.1 hypothetical protein H4R21_000637 [Coemansia helicoidea]